MPTPVATSASSYQYSLAFTGAAASGGAMDYQLTSGGANATASGNVTSNYSGSAAIQAGNQQGSYSSAYNYSASFAPGPSGIWIPVSGNGGGSGNGSQKFPFSQSGDYSDAIYNGTVEGAYQESGEDDLSYGEQISGNVADGGWVLSGTAYLNNNGIYSGSYSASGGYTGLVTQTTPPGTYIGGGTLNESGSDNWSDYETDGYSLSSRGNWFPTTVSGGQSESGHRNTWYVGSGAYSRSINGGTLSGTIQESGADNYVYIYRDTDSDWARTDTEDGNSQYSYGGSGSYAQSGAGNNLSGTANESGGSDGGYAYVTDQWLTDDGDSMASGAGGSWGKEKTNWLYTGDGTYTAAMNGGMISGTEHQSGNQNTTNNYTTTAKFTNGLWATTGGSHQTQSGMDT